MIESGERRNTEQTEINPVEHPLEIEISLKNIADDFETKLMSHAPENLRPTMLETAKRELIDLKYFRKEKTKKVDYLLDHDFFKSEYQKIVKLFSYLGYKMDQETVSNIEFLPISDTEEPDEELTKRVARLRQDGDKFFFTVKGPKLSAKNPLSKRKLKIKPEYQVEITSDAFEVLKKFFETPSHQFTDGSIIKKQRTTYRLTASVFGGEHDVLVDIDEFPPQKGKINRKAEVEGSEDDVLKAVEFIEKNEIYVFPVAVPVVAGNIETNEIPTTEKNL